MSIILIYIILSFRDTDLKNLNFFLIMNYDKVVEK